MLNTLRDYCFYMIVRKGVVAGFAFFSVLYKFCRFKNAQLGGNSRNGHIKHACNIANANFAFKKGVKYAYARAVPENAVKFRKIVKGIDIRHVPVYRFDKIAVLAFFFAKFAIFFVYAVDFFRHGITSYLMNV